MGESKGEGAGERTFRVDPSDLELCAGHRDPDGAAAPRVVRYHRAQRRELGHTPRLVRARVRVRVRVRVPRVRARVRSRAPRVTTRVPRVRVRVPGVRFRVTRVGVRVRPA